MDDHLLSLLELTLRIVWLSHQFTSVVSEAYPSSTRLLYHRKVMNEEFEHVDVNEEYFTHCTFVARITTLAFVSPFTSTTEWSGMLRRDV